MRGRVPIFAGAALAVLAALSVRASDGDPSWQLKVQSRVLAAASAGPVEFLVVLDEQADLSSAASLKTKAERGAFVFERLRETAQRTQAALRAELAEGSVEHRPFWIANMIWVRGDAAVVESMARRPEVLRVVANPHIPVAIPEPEAHAQAEQPETIEWGILKTKADQLWALGYRGQGVVVGGQDTGYEWSHLAIRGRYRGWNGASANHNHNWHDSIHSGGGVCGANAAAPCDDNGHGTHTMGTMVGDDGGANQIGMAPDALWIGCRNMDQGNGTPATYSECFEWFVAPTTVSGQNPDPALAPDVINNSWTCPEPEGCSFDTLQLVVENTRAAGILVVASAGNAGSSCFTVGDPPAIYEASLSVGATDSSDNIASFSSRGPVSVDGSNRLKPNVSAPGVSVRSALPGGGYGFLSGTSMAGPHVVGMAALLMSARPDLIGNVEALETLLEQSAVPLTSGQSCGSYPGSVVPNAVFGHGRIDGIETLFGDADGDESENLEDCRPTDGGLWTASGPAGTLLLSGKGSTTLSWSAPAEPGSTTITYDVVRATTADDFSAATCVLTNKPQTTVVDAAAVADVFFYLVRAKNACGGSLGTDSAGNARTAKTCLAAGGG